MTFSSKREGSSVSSSEGSMTQQIFTQSDCHSSLRAIVIHEPESMPGLLHPVLLEKLPGVGILLINGGVQIKNPMELRNHYFRWWVMNI